MPTEIFEDGLDIHIGLLEAEPVAVGSAYPLPRLHTTGEAETRTFRTVLLENPYLRVTLVPALGGRILGLLDKRTGIEILPKWNSIMPVPGGPRGVRLREGIQLRLSGEDRPNSLGNVAIQIEDPEDEASPGGVWLAESAFAPGLSFHLFVSLLPDRAELRFEARILNRTLAPLRYDGELSFGLGEGTWNGSAFYCPERDAGFGLFSEESSFDGARYEDGEVRFARFGRNRLLAPRQVDSWSVTLTPYSGLAGLSGGSTEVGAWLDGGSVRVQTASPRPGHKLLLLTSDGQTLEAPADLYPEHVLEIDLGELPAAPEALVLVDERREEILRVPARPIDPAAYPQPPEVVEADRPDLRSVDEPSLRRATFDTGRRHEALTILGQRAMARKDLSEADAKLEQALLYNADDPLLWWAKALGQRLQGSEAEPAELLNAHFLAPLEPALRAEGFLAQPMTMGKEPSPLLATLEENPEEFVEVACVLIEHGQLDQASRWIDEALRHRDLAMLRLLMAYCLLQGPRMDAEAAEHVAAAGRVAGAPYPWRSVEIEALRVLHARFPHDAHVKALGELAGL
ncbi:DUF5107 domain-containing protein [Fimbriimonas ginsengisoli]|uniref:DUF5107 domain-containing protein n=1 Tax=Fimbriimonas ginsengisoli Gsoil 348 TaxID=661478 RepID=A0A068NN96_FIMGI|nr:DUF5107 domain-containing protein [Fimbriimonas ginsengisoli]AIE85023.1 hypothetical protein OP10G_1655 [Fimbriimonas ginsengisoli Gsoil 348]